MPRKEDFTLGEQMKNKNLEPIAVVGIGAIMPGALNKDEFWTNIKEGKYCITEIPASYWDYHLFYSPDHKAEDKLYSKIGGFIPQSFKFNSLKYRIPPQIAKQMDTVQHLAIETTRMALEDAGYDKKAYDHNRTAVIIGNSMGGMKNEMSNTRLNRPFLYEILKNTSSFKSLAPADAQKMLDEMDAGVREKFSPINEDSMPGELANVIPGRVANVFDLHGTNFAVDAACATSLAAIDQAVNGLRMGNFDMAIAGGVDQMMSPSAYIKFCKIGALSEDGSYPFDARANGFVMAEGAGMVILKRLSDAVKDGDRVYAVIRAVGASSDGKGKGITAPNPKGQKLAVEKAFEQLDYTPGEVGLLEAHGTGTRVGDATELGALTELFAPYAKPGTIGLGSVKSQIGHAKAAAGIASLIKTALALYNKVLPPSVNFKTPNPIVDWATCPFRVITHTEDWSTNKVRRANVSAFGFGGTNFHVAMEEMNDGLLKPAEEATQHTVSTPAQEKSTMSSSYTLHVPGEKIQSDVLTFSAATKQELFNVLDKAVVAIQYDPTYLPSISYKNHMAKPGKFAVTINVENPDKLKEKIEFFKKTASTQDVWEKESLYLRMKGIYPFTPTEIKPKVCFMFPGQGSQYVDMMKDLAAKYKIVQDTFDEADRLLMGIIGQNLTDTLWSKPGETKEQIALREAAIKKTEMTQPAVLTADIAMMRLLSSFGIKPDVVMGHSLGEYAAAVAAGIFDFENGLKAVCTRGKVMSEIKVEDNGKMASVAAPVERVEPELVRINGYVAVANKNCPTQTVIAGGSKAVDDAIKMFTDMGIQAVQIPVSHAFHSAIVRPAMPQYRAFLDTLTFHAPKMPITTNVTAEFYPSDPEKIKDLMVTQISHSVEWIKQLQTTYDSGVRLFVECGPKRVLSALASNTLSDKKDIKVLASNHPKKGGIVEFNDLFANLISSGIHLDWTGTDMYGDNHTFNPAFVNWVTGNATPVEKTEGSAETPKTCACKVSAPAANNGKKSVVISGIAAGGPGSWDKIFREGVLDEILSGRNMIEPVSAEIQQKQIDKHVEFVIKSKDGNHRFERLTSPMQAIKLAAKGGAFDLEKEFGLPAKWVRSMDRSFQLAIAAGILALKDAGIPLVLYYKPTSTGGYLPDRWGLPAEMIDETGVIFTSAFPVANSMMGDLSKRVSGLLNNKTAKEVRAFCDKFIAQISDPALKAEIEAWYRDNFKDKEIEPEAFTSEFILKTIIIAHCHFCQWIRARGPATAMSAACASTAQAIAVAQDWIKLGRCKRVIVISADDITNDNVSEWILTAFLASGAATTEADVTKAALPFDRRRNGMIVGMGAVSLIVEDEAETAKRGMKPLAKLLSTEIANSGFHVTRLDVGHVAQVMDRLVTHAEKEYGLNRSDIAKQLVFISHETYTPARGGSASAEAYALKSTFGKDVSSVIVSNTKGFTGHSMGAGLEDAIAVRCLNTGLVPPIANFKEADPELEGITLSKGGHYNFKYALRLAAGFGSQLGMTLLEKVWQEGEPRIADEAKHASWLKAISGQEAPVLEVVQNTLRIKDNYRHGVKPALVMEGSQAFVDKVNTIHAHEAKAAAPVVQAPAAAPAPAVALDEASVTKEVVKMVGEKTGYPEDMLDIDLDMEADLGIDTVKQAELFASLREHYGIAQQDGIQLKDYPTIRHCIKFVLANAGKPAAVAPVAAPAVAQAAVTPAPVAKPAPAVQAPAAAPAPAVALDEASVTKEVVKMVGEKTGYPEDMLDIDLDMEADLGIDTVKQAELFASLREHYGIAQQDGIQLKDYPTIRHCINFVLSNAGKAAPVAAPAPAVAPVVQPAPVAAPAPVQSAPVAQAAVAPAAKHAVALDEASVTKEIVKMVAEKTGYPEDMLDLDLDMEADLGIDTVKQAELFAAMREHYGIAQQEGIQLKDYPTIRHCINFALSNAGGKTAEQAAPAVAEQPVELPLTTEEKPVVAEPAKEEIKPAEEAPAAPAPKLIKKPAHIVAEHIGKPQEDALITNPTAPIEKHFSLAERPEREGYQGEHCHEKKLRYVTTVADAPLTERENRRLSKDRTVLLFADNSQLIKAYTEEFKELGVKYHVFTTLKTRSKNTTIVNWESYEETEAALKAYEAEDSNIQGIVYLLGATIKKFDKKASPHAELTKYVMPLFIALRVFEKGLANRQDADTFFAVNTKIDGNFGYTTKEEFNPIVGALTGGTTCYRKDVYERTGAISKLMDFEPTATPDEMAQKTMDEVLHGDMRLMIGTRDNVRSTILSLPTRLDKRVKNFDLAGKTIIFTGSGRGIGAMLSQKIASQYHSKIIVLDIIEIQEKTPLWASMNEAELAALKKQIWEDLKADPTKKATPVMLERAFGRVKDSITLYNNLQKLRNLGSEVEYYHCDVMNSSMMKEVCTKIKAKNGRVDGLIHFAGLERSKLIYDKDPAEYYRIFDVKATSFATFLANNIVRDDGFFAFASSIAGKYGNLGQSDYASANDYLAKSALSLSNQGYRAISIAMSAYKNVGMGVRAGVETFLRSNGVDFVDPEDGMQIFLDEIVYGRVPEIVLTGSLGRLDWDHQLKFDWDEIGAEENGSDDSANGGNTPAAPAEAPKAAAPAAVDSAKATHFLGEVKSLQKGAEIHLEKEFNLNSDPYLADHAIEGTPYVPGVMGIETFMETATALTGEVPQGLKDVHFYLPIKLLRNRPQAVRVIGKAAGNEASMEIESDFINSKGVKMGNTRRHFTAHTLGSFVSTWDSVKAEAMTGLNAPMSVSKEEIYKKYFHGPSFQVLAGIVHVDKHASLAVYHTTPRPQWNDGPRTLLANPMLIEAAFQCCGFQDMSIEHKMTLPDGIAEVAVLNKQVPPAQLYLYGVNRGNTADGKTLHDAYVFDAQGNVWVEIHGYQAIGQ